MNCCPARKSLDHYSGNRLVAVLGVNEDKVQRSVIKARGRLYRVLPMDRPPVGRELGFTDRLFAGVIESLLLCCLQAALRGSLRVSLPGVHQMQMQPRQRTQQVLRRLATPDTDFRTDELTASK